MELFVLNWLFCCVLATLIGAKKGFGYLGFFLGILLGPIGLIIVLLLARNRQLCPYCKSRIHLEATVCPKCQRDLP